MVKRVQVACDADSVDRQAITSPRTDVIFKLLTGLISTRKELYRLSGNKKLPKNCCRLFYSSFLTPGPCDLEPNFQKLINGEPAYATIIKKRVRFFSCYCLLSFFKLKVLVSHSLKLCTIIKTAIHFLFT